jgi:DNA-binding NarL/FixJ family response regulator
MVGSLEEKTLEAIRGAARELAAQSGRGIHRQAIVALGENSDSYVLSIVADEPTFVLARPRSRADFSQLTDREREVAALVARGLRNAEIARELFISTATVKDHVHRILRKTRLSSRTAVAAAWTDTARP